MKILFVASDSMELRGLVPRCADVRPLNFAVDWARAAVLGEHEVVLVANGVGPARSAAAVDAAMAARPADVICSIGFCGALSPDLQVAEIVVADSLATDSGKCLDMRWHAIWSPAAYRKGAVCSLNHVVQRAAEKSQLHALGAIAVEMEAAGVAARAHVLGRPFCCVKSVTDLAHEDLSIEFNSLLRSDGHFDKMGILISGLRHPTVQIPELIRLRKRCTRAQETLGEFIAGCRF